MPSCRPFTCFDHERGEFSPTDRRKLQFREDLVGSGTPERPLVRFLCLVRRYGTKDDALLSRRQVHEVKLTVNPVRPSERRDPMITLQHSQALCSIGGG